MLANTSQTDPRSSIETPSGKDQDDENFPVASIILGERYRNHVKCFYDFARAADDIADNPDLTAVQKIARLNLFENTLLGRPDAPHLEKPVRLRDSLALTGVTPKHASDILEAFRTDARKNRYATWRDLMDYCELSANPVGRYLLDLHGEDPAGFSASDALCTVLQVLNHLQDCGDDRRDLDRVYIPLDWMEAEGADPAMLDDDRLDPAMRRVVDRMLDACNRLLAAADTLPNFLSDTRLAINSATIVCLAKRLSRRLRHGDPLAERVALTKVDFAVCIVKGVVYGLTRARPDRARERPGR